MKKSKIILRLDVYSENDSSLEYFYEIEKILPSPKSLHIKNSERILSNGKTMPFKNKESLFHYELSFESFSLEESHEKFINFWFPYIDSLKLIITKYHFSISLDYEITVYNYHYPAILFPVDFLNFLSDIGIQLTLNFYND